MLRAIQREIDQAIIDEVDLLAGEPKPAAFIVQLARVANLSIEAVLQQQLPGKNKFRIEILLLGLVINDRDSSRRTGAVLTSPFALKHRDDAGFEIFVSGPDQPLLDLPAAGRLGLGLQGIEERPASVGVHFDQLGAVVTEVKIVTISAPAGPKSCCAISGAQERTASR